MGTTLSATQGGSYNQKIIHHIFLIDEYICDAVFWVKLTVF